jgi:PAS domain S-box-containing protein
MSGEQRFVTPSGSEPAIVPPGQREISVYFSSLSYVAPEKTAFAYKIENLQSRWVNIGNRPNIYFFPPPPGNYRVRVKAANNDGVWNETGATVALVVQPFFWQSLWFKILAVTTTVGAVGGSIWAFSNRRLRRRLAAAEDERALTEERHHAAMELARTKQLYLQLVENAFDGICVVQTGVIHDPNPQFCKLLGYANATQLEAKRLDELMHPDDAPTFNQKLSSPIPGDHNQRLNYPIRLRRRDQTTVWVDLNATAISWKGAAAVLCVTQDITERKKADEERAVLANQLHQAQKMEAIGTLAGGIAHDFNNILTGIMGNVELGTMELQSDHPVREILAETLKATHRAKSLVRQILVFSRRREQKRSPIRLWPVVQEALALLRASLPASIEIRLSPPSSDPLVMADATQIHQVIVNLGANASHAMKGQQGRLEVSGLALRLDVETARSIAGLVPGDYLRISISDTGCGMDAATQQRIFEPFFTTKPPGEGTGLGLAVVHGIIQNHQGAISVTSQPSRGSTFHIYLPVSASIVEIPTAKEASITLGRGERALLVDDEKVLLDASSRLLRRAGFEVTVFSDPVAALECFKAGPERFDVVVTDLTMPKMSGQALAGEVKRIRPDIRVVLCTGFGGNLDEAKLRELGVQSVLEKPYSAAALTRAVSGATGSP